MSAPVTDLLEAGDFCALERKVSHSPQLLNAKDEKGQTLLHRTAGGFGLSRAAVAFARFLLVKGADANAESDSKETPLMCAVARGSLEMMRLLLTYQANINCRDRQGNTPLIRSLIGNDLAVFLLLLKRGADLTLTDANGGTVAHWAAYKGAIRFVRVLEYFDYGSFHVRDHRGGTPLHVAAHAGNYTVSMYLIEAIELSPTETNSSDATAIDMARKAGHRALAVRLRRSAKRYARRQWEEERQPLVTGGGAGGGGSRAHVRRERGRPGVCDWVAAAVYPVCNTIMMVAWHLQVRPVVIVMSPAVCHVFEILALFTFLWWLWTVSGDPGCVPIPPRGKTAVEDLMDRIDRCEEPDEPSLRADVERLCYTCWIVKAEGVKHCS
ncbi:unnamed protein product [Vitrella brassicaformis CCMP3155]|uniref:Uncharacterized protein n=1 Tax=Vitrella brassicaformis (strain CCMP3155) TaxID=1169540 RepID=A0A0G4G2Q2_VITBC|nr:unnamed protein product [Vitrella brassicaformis CCMP3155]|eukprot:CEM21964.1 unnamed protein product [Vitrella brassicaformis CCMP3155]